MYRAMRGRLISMIMLASMLGAMLALQWSTHVEAAPQVTITVDTTDIEVPSVVNGNCTLSEAITAANINAAVDGCAAGAGNDTIRLPAGVWDLAATLPAINQSVTIIGAGMEQTILNGDSFEAQILTISSSASPVRIEALSVVNAGGHVNNIGAIAVGSGTTFIAKDVRLANNRSRLFGGAIYAAFATVQLLDSEVVSNTAAIGGGVYATTFSAENTLFQNNQAVDNNDAAGGAARVGNATITGSRFVRNESELGAALHVLNGATIESSEFLSNTLVNTISYAGQAIHLCAGDDVTIANSTFRGNGGAGGSVISVNDANAFCASQSGPLATLTVANTHFSGNGIGFAIDSNRPSIVLEDSRLENNSGGLYRQQNPDASATVRRTVYRDNETLNDYMIFNLGEATVAHSALYRNTHRGILHVSLANPALMRFDRVTIAESIVFPASSRKLMEILGSGIVELDRSTLVNTRNGIVHPLIEIASGATLRLDRSVVADSKSGIDISATGTVESAGGNVIGAASTIVAQGDDRIGTLSAPISAELDMVRQTGEADWAFTAAPLPGSPVIDRIAVNGSANRNAGCIGGDTDQRGLRSDVDYDRDFIVKCDSGAHELQADEQFIHDLGSGESYRFGATLATLDSDSGPALGTTRVVRRNVDPGLPITGIALPVTWDISPTTTSGLDATLTLCYTDWEVAQVGDVVEAHLALFKQDGFGWIEVGRTAWDTDENCVSMHGMSEISGSYALANSATPTAVGLGGISAETTPATSSILLALLTLLSISAAVKRHQTRF